MRRRFAKLGRLREIFASRILDRNYTPLISVKFYGNFCVHQLEMFFAGWVDGWMASRRLLFDGGVCMVWISGESGAARAVSDAGAFAANPFLQLGHG